MAAAGRSTNLMIAAEKHKQQTQKTNETFQKFANLIKNKKTAGNEEEVDFERAADDHYDRESQ